MKKEKLPTIAELRVISKKKPAAGIILPACDYLAFNATWPFLRLPFTPNQITVIWILIKIVMAAFMIKGHYWTTVIALLVFQLASIIDGVDGIIARYRKHYSLNGIYLDYIGHYLCNSLLLIALAWGIFNQTGSAVSFIFAGIAAGSYILSKALTINLAWYKGEERKKVDEIIYEKALSLKEKKNGLVVIVFDLFRMDNPLNVMFWGILFGYPSLTLLVYAILLFLEMVRKLYLQYHRIEVTERT